MKKKLFPALLLFLSFSISLPAQFRCQELKQEMHSQVARQMSVDNHAKSDTFDILHYGLHLDFTTLPSRHISGRCDISISPKIAHSGKINLDLLQLQVDSILQNGQKISFSHDDTIIAASLVNNPAPGDTFQLSVFYQGTPPGDASGWGGWHQQSGYYYNLGVGFAANPHTYGRAWHPCFDNFVEKATYDFHIKTQTPLRPYCNGLRVSETALSGDTILTHWNMTDPIPTYLASVAISNYAEINDSVQALNGNMPIQLMAKPADSLKLVNSFQNLKPTLQAFENAFGPYRWQKIGYCATTVGAMEHATSIHYPTSLINGNLNGEDIMAHELAHHWWGNLVTCETDKDMWINEGMSEFSSHLYTENVYGRERYLSEVRANAFNVLEQAHKSDDGYKALQGLSHEYVYGYHVYQKGAMVGHNLRGYLGDSLFFDGLTTLLNNNLYGNLNSDQFRDQLSQITGVPLNDFFDDWVFNPGFPQVSIDSLHVPHPLEPAVTHVKISQRVHHAPDLFYEMPVYITFFGPDGDTATRSMEINGPTATATFQSLPFLPVFAVANYNAKVLTADTYDEYKVYQPGTLNEKYSKIRPTVNSLQDSLQLIAIYHYAGPGGKKPGWADFRLSERKFWSLKGVGLNDADVSARIDFNGSSLGTDQDLVSHTADSLMVLYREDATQEWQLWSYQQKTSFGSPGSIIGWVELDSIKAGDYVLANTDESIGTPEMEHRQGSLEIYPNPAKGRLQLHFPEENHKEVAVRVITMNGQVVHDQNHSSPGKNLSIELQDTSSEYVIVQVGEWSEKVRLVK